MKMMFMGLIAVFLLAAPEAYAGESTMHELNGTCCHFPSRSEQNERATLVYQFEHGLVGPAGGGTSVSNSYQENVGAQNYLTVNGNNSSINASIGQNVPNATQSGDASAKANVGAGDNPNNN